MQQKHVDIHTAIKIADLEKKT